MTPTEKANAAVMLDIAARSNGAIPIGWPSSAIPTSSSAGRRHFPTDARAGASGLTPRSGSTRGRRCSRPRPSGAWSPRWWRRTETRLSCSGASEVSAPQASASTDLYSLSILSATVDSRARRCSTSTPRRWWTSWRARPARRPSSRAVVLPRFIASDGYRLLALAVVARRPVTSDD